MRLLPSPAEVLVTTTELSRRARLDSNRFVRIDRNASATLESGSRALSSIDAWLCMPRTRGTTPTTGMPRTCSASVLDLIVSTGTVGSRQDVVEALVQHTRRDGLGR